MRAVVSVDVRASALRGVAKLETEMQAGFDRCCVANGISKHLKAKGTTLLCFLAATSALVVIYAPLFICLLEVENKPPVSSP